jgi:type II secretory pathway pseudopilin PulG
MITVAILGILAASARVVFSNFQERNNESMSLINIQQIMNAISIYYGENMTWPVSLTDANFQKYLSAVPPVKIIHPGSGYHLSGNSTGVSVVTANPAIGSNTDGWVYNSASGNVWINNSQTDTTGKAYSFYGYK